METAREVAVTMMSRLLGFANCVGLLVWSVGVSAVSTSPTCQNKANEVEALLSFYGVEEDVAAVGVLVIRADSDETWRLPAYELSDGYLTIDFEFLARGVHPLLRNYEWRPGVPEVRSYVDVSSRPSEMIWPALGYVAAPVEVRKWFVNRLTGAREWTIAAELLASIWRCEWNRTVRSFGDPWVEWCVLRQRCERLTQGIFAEVCDQTEVAELIERIARAVALACDDGAVSGYPTAGTVVAALCRQTSLGKDGQLSLDFSDSFTPVGRCLEVGEAALPWLRRLLDSDAATRCVSWQVEGSWTVEPVNMVAWRVCERITGHHFATMSALRSFLDARLDK